MTREEARREIDSLDFYLQNHTDDYGEESHTAMMMAIKALEQEQESMLDKIRAEIKDNRDEWIRGQDAEWHTYDRCLQIIDKYKADMERK